jgi:hypothetical protein
MRAAGVSRLRDVASRVKNLRAVRRANYEGAQQVIRKLRALRRRNNKKHVAEHGNEREPSDGAPMLAKCAHTGTVGATSMPVNRQRNAYAGCA